MALVNSKKQQLSQSDIVVRAVLDTGAKGQDAAIGMSALIAEMQQDNCYPLPIGNTLFISHANPERTQVFLRIVNVDVHKNLVENVELYIRRAKQSGVKTIVYADPDSANVPIMEHIKKLHLAVVQMERSKKTGWYVFVVTFPEDMKQPQQQMPQEEPVEAEQ